MGKLPWMKFFYADWLRDTRALSVAAKGAWIDTICYAWGSPRRGEIVGTEDSFARMWGCSTREAHTIIIELTTHAICECVTDDHGNVTLMSRRIVREEKQREQARKRKERERSRQCHADGIDACHGSVTAQKSEVRSQKSDTTEKTPVVSGGAEKKTRPVFSPPTIHELNTYASEIGMSEYEAENMHDYYAAKGWTVGKSPMKDWKAAARKWARNAKEYTSSTNGQSRRTPEGRDI